MLSPSKGQVAYALLTRSPLGSAAFSSRLSVMLFLRDGAPPHDAAVMTSEAECCVPPFDLHVLGMPPAFVLSQDQTLQNILVELVGSISY